MATIRIPDELIGRLDAARGDVPRERFVRRLLGEALDAHEHPPQAGVAARASAERRLAAATSSAAARAGVRPQPKGRR